MGNKKNKNKCFLAARKKILLENIKKAHEARWNNPDKQCAKRKHACLEEQGNASCYATPEKKLKMMSNSGIFEENISTPNQISESRNDSYKPQDALPKLPKLKPMCDFSAKRKHACLEEQGNASCYATPEKKLKMMSHSGMFKENISPPNQILESRNDSNKPREALPKSMSSSRELNEEDIISETEELVVEPEADVNSNIIEGCRIIEFQHFFDGLKEIGNHKTLFGCGLSSIEITKEVKLGLLSKFHLECRMCHSKFILHSSDKSHPMNMNEKAVSIVTGIGLSNFNEIVASMDLPIIPFNTYQKCHEKVGEMWQQTAEHTMMVAAKEEADAARARGHINEQGIPKIAVQADCCWSKRSYKTKYSASSGVAAIIGQKTGKVLHIGVRNRYCTVCARATNAQKPIPSHKCSKNHSGSSTSMEPEILVEGFKTSISSRNLIYDTLIADGDASTYKKIMESRPYADVMVKKIECTNHLLRNYNGKNMLAPKDTSIPIQERRLLTPTRITRLRRAVREAAKYRSSEEGAESGKIIKLQRDIINSPNHVFGDHINCDDYYCKPERKGEPNHALGASTILLKLKRHASQLANNSRSLLKNYNTNRAEQFNSVVAKCVGGKRINFSLKKSYEIRCYAAVVSFNTGGQPQTTFCRTVLMKSPVKSLKRLERSRFCQNQKRRQKKTYRKIDFSIGKKGLADYGTDCQKPDMTSEDYEPAKTLFLENLQKQASRRSEIERSTILQAESPLWLELRRCLLTASNFSKICKRRPNLNSAPLVKNILYRYSLDNIASIKHGRDNEATAINQLGLQEKLEIKTCGLFIDEELYYLGATPDGLIEDDGIVEIKCPISCHGIDAETALQQKKLKCFKLKNNEAVFDRNHDWHYQIQGQLHISKKSVCLLGIWTGSEFPMKVVRINRDDEFWAEKMLPKLKKFYNECMLPEIVDPRKSRSMPLRDTIL